VWAREIEGPASSYVRLRYPDTSARLWLSWRIAEPGLFVCCDSGKERWVAVEASCASCLPFGRQRSPGGEPTAVPGALGRRAACKPGPNKGVLLACCVQRRDGISSAVTKGNPGYSVRSTTVALAAFFCTDSTPFLALAFDS
jgi:hypothetical protein